MASLHINQCMTSLMVMVGGLVVKTVEVWSMMLSPPHPHPMINTHNTTTFVQIYDMFKETKGAGAFLKLLKDDGGKPTITGFEVSVYLHTVACHVCARACSVCTCDLGGGAEGKCLITGLELRRLTVQLQTGY